MRNIRSDIHRTLGNIYAPQELKSLTMIICRDMLEINVTDIYLDKGIDLSENKRNKLQYILERLQKHEPIQYVRGTADFLGLCFRVMPGVLIPRPETEELTEMIIKENRGSPRILDIGTGSGCIAISLSKNLPGATVSAWDISEEALAVARDNNKQLKADVTFYNKNILNMSSSCTDKYDVIVSNPPYIREAEKEEMEANVLHWEPDIALFVPNDDPLLFYRCIARLGMSMLSAGGKLYFEINQACGEDIALLLKELDYQNVRVLKDLFGKDRFATAQKENV